MPSGGIWRSTGKFESQTRKDPGSPVVVDRGGSEFSALAAEERNLVPGQEAAEDEERVHEDMAGRAKEGELDAWK